jgi:predicted nuclease of predicted toxin-antitoxin system
MTLRLYMDHNVRRAVTVALRARQVDVITAEDDGRQQLADPELLDRATSLGRVVFSQDSDFLREAAARQRGGQTFAGVVFAAQLGITIGQCIEELELIAKVYDPPDIANRVEFLPL